MKNHARVVVIGGGIAGCSTLYHLTREGWSNVVLVERDEITSGTTWHSAAQVTNFGPVQTMVGLKSYSIRLYRELADDPNYPINYHHGCGGVRLASTPDHLDGYHHFVSMARGMGVEFEAIDAAECARRHPLITTGGLLGALWDPLDGDIDPAQLCQALARRARNAGAEIYRFNPVEAISKKPNHEWVVHTRNGDITCEKVVNAGDYASTGYTACKAVEDYRNEFRFHLPHEHRPAGRPARSTPLYPVLDAAGAAFGVVNGWERATFFKPRSDFEERPSFRFPSWHDTVALKVKAVQDAVAIMEVSGFNRYAITGPGVRPWLDALSCSRVPSRTGRVALAYFLNDHGKVLGEATLAVLDPQRIWYGSAAAAEIHDWDWLSRYLPTAGVTMTSLTGNMTTLVIAGPRSRALLAAVAPRADVSRDAFPWLSVRSLAVAHVHCVAFCISYCGELAFELHVRNEQLHACHAILCAAGEEFGLRPFGLHAAESMRLEKGFRHWKADLITEFDPMESGLERFVKLDKPDFSGKRALLERIERGPRRRFATLILDTTEAPAHPGDSVLDGERVVGTVTSAGWGHRVNKNIAMAFIEPALADPGTRLQLQVLGQCYEARVCEPCLYDPDNMRMAA